MRIKYPSGVSHLKEGSEQLAQDDGKHKESFEQPAAAMHHQRHCEEQDSDQRTAWIQVGDFVLGARARLEIAYCRDVEASKTYAFFFPEFWQSIDT